MTTFSLGFGWVALVELFFLQPPITFAPAILGLAMLLGAAAAAALWPFRHAWRPTTWVVGAVWAASIAWLAFSGRFAWTLPFRSVYQLLVFVLGMAVIGSAIRLASSIHSRGRQLALGLGLLVVSTLTVVADQQVLPRLYPFLHWSLRGAGAIAATLGVWACRPDRCFRLPVFLCALGGGPVALVAVGTFSSLRHTVFQTGATSVLQFLPLWAENSRVFPTALAASPSHPFSLPGRDVFLLTVDALRADRMGAYGYARRTTPSLDQLARRGVVFDRGYAPMPHTSFSIASLLTGRYVHTRTMLGQALGETLPDLLRVFRLKTAAFFPPSVFFIDRERFLETEKTAYGFEYVKYEFLDAAKRTAQVADFLRQDGANRQAFVWVHYFEPHEPYLEHPGFHFGDTASDRYDSEVAATDQAIGDLLQLIERERPNAIVIVTADHGEEFGDHGGYYHGTTLYEEQIRVPLIIAAPGIDPRRVSPAVSTLDLAPTILSLLDIPPPASMDGEDLSPYLAGTQTAPHGPVMAEVQNERMIVSDRFKLVCNTASNACRFHDLAQDPQEHKNAIDQQPVRVNALRSDLASWLERLAEVQKEDPIKRAFERARLGDATVVPTLLAALRDQDVEQARHASALLFDFAKVLQPSAMAELQSSDPEVSDWLTLAKARAGDSAAREDQRKLLNRSDLPPDLRFACALALGEQGEPLGVPRLIEELESGQDFERRRAAALVLGNLRDARALNPLMAALSDVRLRRYVVEALGNLASARPGVCVLVAGNAASKTPLSALSGPVLPQRLIATVRAKLCHLLDHDPYISVRKEAASALEKIGGLAATTCLSAAVRAGALHALPALRSDPIPP